MAVSNIGKNGAEEFMETIIFMTAYEEAKSVLSGFTDDIDNEVLKEAVEGASQVVMMGLIFQIIRYEESLLDKVFVVLGAFTAGTYALGKKALNRVKAKKGAKVFGRALSKYVPFLDGLLATRRDLNNTLVAQSGNYIAARQGASNNATAIHGQLIQTEQRAIQGDNHRLNLGDAMSKNFVNSLMFKTMTGNFTDKDKVVMKKILGRDVGSQISIDELNKTQEFMFAKDSSGNLTGLSTQFMELINGLAYTHNK